MYIEVNDTKIPVNWTMDDGSLSKSEVSFLTTDRIIALSVAKNKKYYTLILDDGEKVQVYPCRTSIAERSIAITFRIAEDDKEGETTTQ